ncbi:hypothetical protein V494_01262 [Pseudogymnoascus sp. VKM F-4513 (FW-928)]|nr:hypothetical protein V494_01262 [Pseudogymnoascus sp. VKM F-4513 (FW-928)]
MLYPTLRILALSAAVITSAQALEQDSDTPIHPEWLDSNMPNGAGGDENIKREIPSYVMEYAPLVHLAEDEIHWPSLMDEHLLHTKPYVDFTPVPKNEQHPTLSNLGDLNRHENGLHLYLQSRDDVLTSPAWMLSAHNMPVPPPASPEGNETDSTEPNVEGKKTKKEKKISKIGGRSPAPVVLTVVEKEDNVVLAFWFYFYSYNLGNSVFGVGFGDHVGDWEHSVMKFRNGVPETMFISQHTGGRTYTFGAMEKYGKRPVIYSAKGSHAMYATPGIQAYILPFAILHDTTSHGPLWDPALNVMSYHYTSPDDHSDVGAKFVQEPSAEASDFTPGTLTPTLENPNAPTSWFYYGGCWGDKGYPSSDPRQYHAPIIGERKFVDGPFGPRFKSIGRPDVCIQGICEVSSTIAPRLWLLDWLYNWAWVCGGFLAIVVVGIAGYIIGRHVKWGHAMLIQIRKGRKKMKVLADVERSPLLSEATSEAEDGTEPSVVALDVDAGRAVAYGTINATVVEDSDRVR